MKAKTIIEPRATPLQKKEGGVKITDKKSFKIRLKKNLGLSKEKFSNEVWRLVEDEEETLSNKALAIQNMKRKSSKSSEDVLLKIVSKRDRILSHDALNVLSAIGTEKSFESLSKQDRFSNKLLQRRKDFTMLLIAYRNQLPNTDKLLKKLTKKESTNGKIESFPIGFKMMDKRRISKVLDQINRLDYGIKLSENIAFEVKVASQTFYFCFTNSFDNPSEWHKTLQTKQIAGQLLRKEEHQNYLAKQYVALITPNKESALLSIFRKDGQLFMTANIGYDSENDSFNLENSLKEKSRKKSKSELQIDQNKRVRINLTYIRRENKKNTTAIEA